MTNKNSQPKFGVRIGKYNSVVVFVSFSALRKDIPNEGSYSFKTQDQIYLHISIEEIEQRRGEAC